MTPRSAATNAATPALLDTPHRGAHDDSMALFRQSAEVAAAREAPLAARMRPQTLEEMVGQSHLLGRGHVLRQAIENDVLTSVILYSSSPSNRLCSSVTILSLVTSTTMTPPSLLRST